MKADSLPSWPIREFQLSSAQPLSRVRLFATPWIEAHQASLSITISRSSLKLMSIESVMPSSHLILCNPLLLLPPIPPSIRVFSNKSHWKRKWQPTPVFLPGESHGQRSLVGCSPWGHRESDTTERLTHTYTITGGPERQVCTSMSCLHSSHTSHSVT